MILPNFWPYTITITVIVINCIFGPVSGSVYNVSHDSNELKIEEINYYGYYYKFLMNFYVQELEYSDVAYIDLIALFNETSRLYWMTVEFVQYCKEASDCQIFLKKMNANFDQLQKGWLNLGIDFSLDKDNRHTRSKRSATHEDVNYFDCLQSDSLFCSLRELSGNVHKAIVGTMAISDSRRIHNAIKNLESNMNEYSNSVSNSLMSLTDLSSSLEMKLKNVENNQAAIHASVKYTLEKFKSKQNNDQRALYFTNITEHLSQDIEKMIKTIDNIASAITKAKGEGQLAEKLINVQTIVENFLKMKKKDKIQFDLPFSTSDGQTIVDISEICSVYVQINKGKFMYMVKLPLVSKDHFFTAYKLMEMPIEPFQDENANDASVPATIQLSVKRTSVFALRNDSSQYITVHNSAVDTMKTHCKQIRKDLYSKSVCCLVLYICTR